MQTAFYTNEAAFDLPGVIAQDSSLNMLKLANPEAVFIISRGAIQDDETLETAIDQQLEKLGKQVKELKFTPRQATHLGVEGQIEGIELKNEFIRGDDRVHQYQAAFLLPGTRIMMALSYVKTRPLTDEDATRWHALKKGIRLRIDPVSPVAH